MDATKPGPIVRLARDIPNVVPAGKLGYVRFEPGLASALARRLVNMTDIARDAGIRPASVRHAVRGEQVQPRTALAIAEALSLRPVLLSSDAA